MPDFQQNIVPTFSRLDTEDLASLEESILESCQRAPIGIIIPALFSDLSSEAMGSIIRELCTMKFVRRIYVSLDRASAEEFARAREIMRPLKESAVLLWNDAPQVQRVIANVNAVLHVGPRGKGQAVWCALGYALGQREVSVLVFHDADIVTYDRAAILRLLYPVVHLRYQFSKGYYARYSDRLHGRVSRLFYFPLIRALRGVLGRNDFLDYMADFRYPLSGEFATFASIANELLVPSDWGIEVGTLAEMYRITRPHRICQVEIASRYDHKHQELGTDVSYGLLKMASDIARTFFTHLSAGGCVLTQDFLRTLKHTYIVTARSYVRIYEAHAEMNHLQHFDLHRELEMIEAFAAALENAFADYQNHLFGSPLLPDWRRIEVALEGTLSELVKAFEAAWPPGDEAGEPLATSSVFQAGPTPS
jgi:glucosyl-3-phosphoglycerate synthase